ncbi:MAG: helix-turn-helix domain-containing protein [Saprospiraceae bacterium]
MTEKQKNILEAALFLFAKEGYASTSTSKIAKLAGVSEGLIFRHFENKQGLLDALMREAERRLNELFVPILLLEDPKQIITDTLSLPFQVAESDYDFWRLQYILKWEVAYSNPDKMKPILDKLSAAFSALGFAHPEQEAFMLVQVLDSTAIALIRNEIQDKAAYKTFLLSKYN